jgi:hypothetical protein
VPNYSVKVLISAIDRATGPIRALSATMSKLSGPISNLRGRLGQLKQGFMDTFVPLATTIAVAGGALVGLMLKYGAFSKELKHTAFRLGLTTTALQEYQYAAKRSAVDSEKFDRGFQRFTKIAGDAGLGSKSAVKAFTLLGLSVRGANGHMKDSDTLFMQVMGQLSKISDPLRRNALAANFFGAKNLAMVQMIHHGVKGIRELREEAEAMGIVLSEKAVNAFAAFSSKLTSLKMATFNLAGTILGDYMPAVNKGMDAALMWVHAHQKLIKMRVHEFFDKAIPAVQSLANALVKLIGGIDSVAQAIGGWGNLLYAVMGFKLAGFVVSIIKVGGAVMEAVGAFGALVTGGELAWEMLGIGIAVFEALTNPIVWVIAGITAIALLGPLLYNNWNTVSTWFSDFWGKWGDLISLAIPPIGIIVALAGVIIQHWGEIKKFFGDLWKVVGDIFKSFATAAMDTLGPLFDLIKKMLNGAAELAHHIPNVSNIAGSAAQLVVSHTVGKRALGGPVRAGKSYLVGEKGPELFSSSNSGYITPNNQLASASGGIDRLDIHMKVDAEGRADVLSVKSSGKRSIGFSADMGYAWV